MSERRFPFAAIDPGGMPRTGTIKAASSQAAESKLQGKGFTAVKVGACEPASPEIELKTQSKGSQAGLAERRGYQRSWGDSLEDSAQAASKMRPAAYILLVLGLLLTIVYWAPSEEKGSEQQAEVRHTLKLDVIATVEAEPEGQRLVIEFPEIPYSWDGSLEEILDQNGQVKKQFDFSTTRKPSLVKLSILNPSSNKTQLSDERSLSEGQSSVDFGALRIR